jgi:hypothetical protein
MLNSHFVRINKQITSRTKIGPINTTHLPTAAAFRNMSNLTQRIPNASGIISRSISRSRMAVSPTYRLSTHAMYDYGRGARLVPESLKRYRAGGERLRAARALALALAALALEASRVGALCDAAYVERSGILEGHSSMTYWSRLKRAANAVKRVGILACLFTPAAVMAPLSLATKNVFPSMTEMTWDYILYSIEVAGPTFIKLSQWASTRSDLFPQEFCLRFAKLQDATRGHSWGDTDKTLRLAFGDKWTEVIELDESRRPIGSGCIAQVYHGKVRGGEGVLERGESEE